MHSLGTAAGRKRAGGQPGLLATRSPYRAQQKARSHVHTAPGLLETGLQSESQQDELLLQPHVVVRVCLETGPRTDTSENWLRSARSSLNTQQST